MTDTLVRIPTLDTARLTLRAPAMADFPAYAAFRGSDRARLVGGPYTPAQSFDHLAALIGHWHLRGFGRWTVVDRASGAPVGIVGLFQPLDWPEPEIAWSVFDGCEGRGYAAEAALAARAFAYGRLGWSRVVSLIDAENARSLAVARRLGATYERDCATPLFGTLQVWRHRAPAEAAA